MCAIIVILQQISCAWVRISSYITTIKQFSNTDTDGFISQFGNPNIPANYMTCSAEGSYITLNAQSQSATYMSSLSANSYSMYLITYDLKFLTCGITRILYRTVLAPIRNQQLMMRSKKQVFLKDFAIIRLQSFNLSILQQILLIFLRKCLNEKFTRICPIVSLAEYVSEANQTSVLIVFFLVLLHLRTHVHTYAQAQLWLQAYIPDQLIKYVKGVCEPYSSIDYYNQFPPFLVFIFHIINLQSNLNDKLFMIFSNQIPENIQFDGYYIYGLFINKQGLYRVLTLPTNPGSFMIAFTLDLLRFNKMPPLSSIQFLINDNYYGQLYTDDQGNLKADKLFRYYTETKQNTVFNGICYTDNLKYCHYKNHRELLVNLFYVVGDQEVVMFILGIVQSINCLRCEEKFKCAQCQGGYLKSKWGTCSQCLGSYQQKINTTHCQEDDDQTNCKNHHYIRFQIHYQRIHRPRIRSRGIPRIYPFECCWFLKGSGIYYSIWKSQQRIFEGPFIWAQAKFQRIVAIEDPHHAITISFYGVFGPNFPEDGSFIFSLDGIPQTELTSSNSTEIVIKRKQICTYNSITVQFECLGIMNLSMVLWVLLVLCYCSLIQTQLQLLFK
ncbi:unnamed protein product [Paramecium octaurelia]|uniref:Uncharacterized protein n=1 Tax=Paramecium octaurelia TaxID=43137 RepID=A0A8S1VA08_PAROT|nr:unnamed protein product [Paramecium octaurelia]